MVVRKKLNDINQEVFSISIFFSLSWILLDSNRNILLDSNQMYNFILIR